VPETDIVLVSVDVPEFVSVDVGETDPVLVAVVVPERDNELVAVVVKVVVPVADIVDVCVVLGVVTLQLWKVPCMYASNTPLTCATASVHSSCEP